MNQGSKSILYYESNNICAESEKLVLLRIQSIKLARGVDLTNRGQHGFKKNKSTNTVGLLIQWVLTRSLDEANVYWCPFSFRPDKYNNIIDKSSLTQKLIWPATDGQGQSVNS